MRLGVRIKDLPMTMEKVLKALKELAIENALLRKKVD